MTTPLESPMPVIFLGIVALAMLATIFVSTRKRSILLAMVGVLALVFAGVAMEWLVVTEKEQVETTLDGAIEALEANDLARLLDNYVAPSATYTRARAAFAHSYVEVTSAKANGLEISINDLTSPPTAEARFTGVVRYRFRNPQTAIPRDYYAAGFVVKLRRENDRWLITGHEERELRGF